MHYAILPDDHDACAIEIMQLILEFRLLPEEDPRRYKARSGLTWRWINNVLGMAQETDGELTRRDLCVRLSISKFLPPALSCQAQTGTC